MREVIDGALHEASRAKDRRRINTLRLISAAIRDRDNAALAAGRERMSDEEVLAILAKMIKQRLESARSYEEGGRVDLAEEEREEIAIIKSFLPRQLTDEEIRSVCTAAIRDTGSQSLRDMGRCMAELKSRYSGKMDFGKAIQIVREELE